MGVDEGAQDEELGTWSDGVDEGGEEDGEDDQ